MGSLTQKEENRYKKTEKQQMANLPVQLLAYLTALIGGLLMIVAVILPFWKEPDFEGVVDRTNGKTQGLFWRCTFSDVGHWDCTDKNRWFFAREQWWVACSTMAILSCSLWATAMFATLPGMNCTVFFHDDKERQERVVKCNCVAFLACGLMNLISSAIYAKEVMLIWQENRNKGKVDNYQWGRCIYLAACSGWILLASSIVMFWASRNEKDEVDERGSQLIIHTASTKKKNGKVNSVYTPDYI